MFSQQKFKYNSGMFGVKKSPSHVSVKRGQCTDSVKGGRSYHDVICLFLMLCFEVLRFLFSSLPSFFNLKNK